jgi:hypothetical protein
MTLSDSLTPKIDKTHKGTDRTATQSPIPAATPKCRQALVQSTRTPKIGGMVGTSGCQRAGRRSRSRGNTTNPTDLALLSKKELTTYIEEHHEGGRFRCPLGCDNLKDYSRAVDAARHVLTCPRNQTPEAKICCPLCLEPTSRRKDVVIRHLRNVHKKDSKEAKDIVSDYLAGLRST